jgi:hypothetical protein
MPWHICATVAAFAEFPDRTRRKKVKQQINGAIAKAALLAALAVFAALTMVPTARAQNYGPWSAPVNLNAIVLSDGTPCPAVVNSTSDDHSAGISKDGLTLIYTSNRPDGLGGADLWFTKRDSLDDCWQPPKNLKVLNSTSNDGVPNITTDGHWLYFNSARPTSLEVGGADLYVSHRQDAGDDLWEAPINLGPTINVPGFFQNGPDHFEDDATGTHYLYSTQKPIGTSEDHYHIYVSTCTADLATCNTPNTWGPGVPVDALNSPFNSLLRDSRMAIRRRDGLEIIFSSGRPGAGLATENLWVSTRATTQDQNWLPPVPINCEWQQNVTAILNSMPPPVPCPSWAPSDPPGTVVFVNSPDIHGGAALSWDGTELYSYSTRTDLPGHKGGQDLYVSKRTKLPD